MIKCINVTKTYSDFKLNVNCEIKQGLITGLIGRNGAGKSTLFKAILGLINTDDGQIYFNDQRVDKSHPLKREMIGCVLTDAFFNQFLCVNDIKGILKRTYIHFDAPYFDMFITRYNIPTNKRIRDLSTGMKAIVKIACALAHHPELLILDEPTNGLDVIARDEILDILRQFMEEDANHSILISSHIFSDLENLCDEIIMMHHGRVSLVESMDELSSNYGVIKANQAQFNELDKQYLIASVATNYGYQCITNQMKYYVENYPDIVIEKCSMNEIFTVLEKGI